MDALRVTRSNRFRARMGGYFLLLAEINRPIMPTINMPNWIRSEYVTIHNTPFPEIGGAEATPERGQPPTVTGSTVTTISHNSTKCKRNSEPPHIKPLPVKRTMK